MQKRRADPLWVKLQEAQRQTHLCRIEDDTPLEDALDPAYLWNANPRINAGDIVEITNTTHEFYARLYVAAKDHITQSIRCHVMERYDWRDAVLPQADLGEARIEYLGDELKFSVVLGHTKLKTGFKREADAKRWLAEFATDTIIEPEKGGTFRVRSGTQILSRGHMSREDAQSWVDGQRVAA